MKARGWEISNFDSKRAKCSGSMLLLSSYITHMVHCHANCAQCFICTNRGLQQSCYLTAELVGGETARGARTGNQHDEGRGHAVFPDGDIQPEKTHLCEWTKLSEGYFMKWVSTVAGLHGAVLKTFTPTFIGWSNICSPITRSRSQPPATHMKWRKVKHPVHPDGSWFSIRL